MIKIRRVSKDYQSVFITRATLMANLTGSFENGTY